MQISEKANSSTKKQCIFGFLRKYENTRTIRQASAQLCGIIICKFENRLTHATMAAMTQNATRHTTVITEQTPEARV